MQHKIVVHLDRDSPPKEYVQKWDNLLKIIHEDSIDKNEYMSLCNRICNRIRKKFRAFPHIPLTDFSNWGFTLEENEHINFVRRRELIMNPSYSVDELVATSRCEDIPIEKMVIVSEAICKVLSEYLNDGLNGSSRCVSGNLQFDSEQNTYNKIDDSERNLFKRNDA